LTMYESLIGEGPWNPNISVEDKVRNFRLDEDDRNGYVFFPLIPGYPSLCIRFCVLGHAFRTKGYEPIILRDDNDLPARPELTINDKEKFLTVEACRYRSKKYPEIFGINTVSIDDILGSDYEVPDVEKINEENLQSFTYRGINLTGCAAASTKKYLKRYTLDLKDSDIRGVFGNFLRSGMILADATQEIIDRYDVKITVVNEGNYIQGKVPLDICERNGIRVYHQSNGYHKGKIIFGKPDNRYHMPHFSDGEITARVVDTELSEEQRERIGNLMRERKGGKITPTHYTTHNDVSVETGNSRLVGIFSHLLWDAALEPEQAIYDDIYGWLDETIETASQKEDTQFVIKAHPAEDIRGTNESTGDWIEENHAPLPDNIDFLPPDTNVNTYALIEDLDAGIVYASTVGLEMALDGVPVLVGGYPPYHGFGITHDPSSKSEYIEKLQNIENLEHGEERKKRAWRFAYFHFICKHLDFPPLAKPEEEVRLEHEDFVGEDSVYATIVDQILKGEEVIQPGCMGLK